GHLGMCAQRVSVLLVVLEPALSGFERVQLSHLYEELIERLRSTPGVRSATFSGTTPIEGGAASRFVKVEGFDEQPDARRRVMLNWVGPQYFEALGTPLIAGRDFELADEGRLRVAIV